jgi:hypothetical protein
VKNKDYDKYINKINNYLKYKNELKDIIEELQNFNCSIFNRNIVLLLIPLGINFMIYLIIKLLDSLFNINLKEVYINIFNNFPIIENIILIFFVIGILYSTKIYELRKDYIFVKYILYLNILNLIFIYLNIIPTELLLILIIINTVLAMLIFILNIKKLLKKSAALYTLIDNNIICKNKEKILNIKCKNHLLEYENKIYFNFEYDYFRKITIIAFIIIIPLIISSILEINEISNYKVLSWIFIIYIGILNIYFIKDLEDTIFTLKEIVSSCNKQ